MGTRIIKLPDVGEGVAEAEIVEWHVEVGESVREDQLLAAVMTDKATVEIPSPVAGEVVALGAEVGGVLAVGAELVRLEVAGEGNEEVAAAPREAAAAQPPAEQPAAAGARRHRRLRRNRAAGTVCARRRRSRVRRSGRRGRPARSRSPRRRCGGARARPASICARCAAPARPAASATTISTPSCAAAPQGRAIGGAGPPTPRSRPSRSSACAGASPRRWRSPSAGSRISPMSRRSTSPRSRSCARRSTRENRRIGRASRCCRS